jgi:serine/threonine protein kinase
MPGTRTRYCSRCLTTFPVDADACPNLTCRAARPATGWGEMLEPGEMIDRTYRVHRMLAIGGAGITYLAGELGPDGQSEVGPRVAVKVLFQQRDSGSYLQRLFNEAQILRGLAHEHIVECRGFSERTGQQPYLVTRFEEGGSLLDHVRRVGTLPIPVAAAVARQICWALEVAHRKGVIHRDLKPENVLLTRPVAQGEVPQVRVADFGIAKVFGGMGDRLTRVGAFVGTPQYAAPEQFDGLAPEPATDIYALGAVFYFCVAGRPVADHMGELDPESQKEHLLRHLPPRIPAGVGTPELRSRADALLARTMSPMLADRPDALTLEVGLAALSDARQPGAAAGSVQVATSSTRTMDPTRDETDDLPANATAVPDDLPPPLEAVPGAPSPSRPHPPRMIAATGGGTPGRPASGVLPPIETVPGPPVRPRALPSFVVVGAFVMLFGAVASVGGLLWWSRSAPLLSDGADWQVIAATLGTRGVAAERACGAPPYLAVEITVDGAGALTRAELLNYDHEPTRACIEERLRTEPFPRAADGRVRVAVTLPE